MKNLNRLTAFTLITAMAFTTCSIPAFAQDETSDDPTVVDNTGTQGTNVTNEDPTIVNTPAAQADNVAMIGEQGYASLPDAVAAVTDDTATTITLLADASGDGVRIPEDRNITIDFGGHTYTVDGNLVGSAGTESQAFQLLKDSHITLANGTITSQNASMLVQNYSDLTLTNMTLNGSGLAGSGNYTLSNNYGDVVIENTTISAKEGGYAFDLYYWPSQGYADGVNVTVKGTSRIEGNIEYGGDGTAADTTEKAGLTIDGGTFSGKIVMGNIGDAEKGNIVVNGGNFTDSETASEITAKYLGAGVVMDENGNVVPEVTEDNGYQALEKAIEEAKKLLTDESYTQDSRAALKTVIDEVSQVTEDATADVVKTAYDQLAASVANLKKISEEPAKPDKTGLQEAIKLAEQWKESLDNDGLVYEAEGMANLAQAIAAAKQVNDNEDATEAEIANAIAQLTTAMDNVKQVIVTLEDEKTGVVISANAAYLDPNTQLSVTMVTEKNATDTQLNALGSLTGDYLAYDIHLYLDGEEIHPEHQLNFMIKGSFHELLNVTGDNDFIAVYYISADGSKRSVGYAGDDEGIHFFSDHGGTFVITRETDKENVDENDTEDKTTTNSGMKNPTGPNTGIDSNVLTYLMMLLGGGAYLGVSTKKRKENA